MEKNPGKQAAKALEQELVQECMAGKMSMKPYDWRDGKRAKRMSKKQPPMKIELGTGEKLGIECTRVENGILTCFI